jgi:hypothetical protein
MTEDNLNILSNELQADTEIQNHLLTTATWAKITAVCGFIISILIVVFAYLFVNQLSRQSYFYGSRGLSTGEQVALIFYIIVAIVHAILSFLQFRFASNIQIAIHSTDQFAFTKAFQTLKTFAIIRAIVAILTGLLFIFGLLGIASR